MVQYDLPLNIKWQDGAPMPWPEGVANHTAVLCDEKVYIGGGVETGYGVTRCDPSNRIDVYTPANNSWSPSPIKTSYHYFAMTTLNNQVITAGGKDGDNEATNKIFSLDGDHLKEYTRMVTPRFYTTAAGYQGILIITGGKEGEYRILATTELFDSTTEQWYTTSNLPLPHYCLHSVIVHNTLFLLGGMIQDKQSSTAVFTAPLDTISSHQLNWSSQQNTPWCYSAPVSIQGKLLLIVGGEKKKGYRQYVCTSDIHMFNQVSHSWEVIGQIPLARGGPTAVCVADHKIVVIGGSDDSVQCTNTVWIGSYKPQ